MENLDKKTHFQGLCYEDEFILKEWIEYCDFIEYFNAYLRNYLQIDKEYRYKNLYFELVKKERAVLLMMWTGEKWHSFSKLEASQLVHKCNRVLARCDLFHV